FNYLTTTKGIAASRLTKLGFGETQLKVPTMDNTANADNRRAEVTLDRVVYTGNVNVFRDRATISGASQTNPVVITTPTPHGLSNGAQVVINDIVGMVELNGRQFTITVVTPTSFSLNAEDGTVAHTAYVSGGTWRAVGTITNATQ